MVDDETKVDASGFVKKTIQREEPFLRQECWNINMAVNHTLREVKAELKRYLESGGLGASGRLERDKIDRASLCGMTVQGIEHIMNEIALENNVDKLEPLTACDLARLLQVLLILAIIVMFRQSSS